MAVGDGVLGVAHSTSLKASELEGNAEHMTVVSICLFVSLLCACIVVGHLLEENQWTNQCETALLLGLGTGIIVLIASKGYSSHVLKFNEELFFIYLLPPIIFNAGFSVKKKEFFRNFIAIMLFGIVGVFISFAIISVGTWLLFPKLGLKNLPVRDILAIGVIFSATDSVCTLQVLDQDSTPMLYSLVFGEGVVNDATSVVLFRAFQTYNFDHFTPLDGLKIGGNFLYLFFTSTVLGIVSGLVSAYIIRKIYFGRESTDREIAIMILMAYLSYTFAELFELTGILSVFFCGIMMSHYTWHNVTEHSRTTTKHTFATMSFIAEVFIFLYVGMDAVDIDKWRRTQSSFRESAGLLGGLMFLIMLGRAAFVFPLSACSNFMTNSPRAKINLRQMSIIWWAGLMRGAVSIALAFNQFTMEGDAQRIYQNATVITSTITVVLTSTIVFGTLTSPLIAWLYPPQHRPTHPSKTVISPTASLNSHFHIPLLHDEEQQDTEDGPQDGTTVGRFFAGIPRPHNATALITAPRSTIHDAWRKFDDAFMRPKFGGKCYERIHSHKNSKNPSQDLDDDEDEEYDQS